MKVAGTMREISAGFQKDAQVKSDEDYAAARLYVPSLLLLTLLVGAAVLRTVHRTTKTIQGALDNLGTSGAQVASASTQIASTSQSLSQGASEQAASLEEISASMEEMTAMARRNGENSSEATGMMKETARQVERSNEALREMESSMEGIKASSEKVAKIIKTIDEIAFQTNILALNAAVEAARAGEAGMGFAVVADEVRNLAQRSAVAAKDTAALIAEAIANSNRGAEKLGQVTTAIREITESAGKVKTLVDEVSESSTQQTQGIHQTSTAVTQVSKVTQTAAASAEESAAASQELSAQAQSLRDLVQMLRSVMEGEGNQALRESMGDSEALPERSAAATVASAIPAMESGDPFPMEVTADSNFKAF
jgi:methyl-accepting chemotaxis protein/methyl-accepting chemotaxis protein-1 (serine sensor receptor)